MWPTELMVLAVQGVLCGSGLIWLAVTDLRAAVSRQQRPAMSDTEIPSVSVGTWAELLGVKRFGTGRPSLSSRLL